jgi:hypothetical protein
MLPKTFFKKNEISGFLYRFVKFVIFHSFGKYALKISGKETSFAGMRRIATRLQFLGVLPSFPNAFMLMTMVTLPGLAEKKGRGRTSMMICTVMEAWKDFHF